jgi:hypothetical protein
LSGATDAKNKSLFLRSKKIRWIKGMASMLGALALFLIAAFLGYSFLGLSSSFMGLPYGLAILFGLAVLLVARYMGVGVARAVPLTKQTAGIAGVILVLAVAWTGGWLAMFTGAAVPAATFTQASVTGLSATQCAQQIQAANPTILGKAATLTVKGYDFAANAPYSTAVGAGYYVFKDGQFVAEAAANGGTITNLKVGDVIDIYGKSNASFYVDNALQVCITGEQNTKEIRAYAAAQDSNMKVTCYDSDGNTLSAAGNISAGDYNLTLGANEKAKVTCKLKENAANKNSWIGAIAVKAVNNTKDVKVMSSGWALASVPTFLATAQISVSELPNVTVAGYGKLYTATTPVKLGQWQETVVDFEVSSDTSNDPVYIALPTATNLQSNAIIQFVDTATGRDGVTGASYNDVATRDDAQTNLGISESFTSPIGKQTGTIINII